MTKQHQLGLVLCGFLASCSSSKPNDGQAHPVIVCESPSYSTCGDQTVICRQIMAAFVTYEHGVVKIEPAPSQMWSAPYHWWPMHQCER